MPITLSDNIKKSIIWVLTIAMSMEMLDTSILNTSLPQIAHSLNINPIELKAALTVYLLSVGIFIPISGWVADRMGERPTLLFAIIIFTLSSIGCGLATNLPTMIACRFLQGIGGAFLMPIGRLILVRIFEGSAGVQAMAKVTSVAMLGLLLGPLIGGALTTYINWRWIFYINVPLGVVGVFYVYFHLPDFRERLTTKFDLIGFILIGIALGSLLYLFDIIINQHISIAAKILMLFITISAFTLYRFHAKRSATPLFDLNLFHQPMLMLAASGSFLSRLTISAHPFLVPLMLQTAYGFSALKAGLFTVPSAVAIIFSKTFVSALLTRLGYKRVLLINTTLLFILVSSYVFQAYALMPTLLIVQQFFVGLCMSVQFTCMNSFAYQNLHEPYISQGASLYSGVVQVSGSFGIALAALTMIAVIGQNDLQHYVPLVAFKVVFLVQAIYLLLAGMLFWKIKVL